jgi:GTP-binding protein EngB required for normal cell division
LSALPSVEVVADPPDPLGIPPLEPVLDRPPPVPADVPTRLGTCIARLDDGIAAAGILGLNAEEAIATRREAGDRLGFASNVCVVALIGGTGVGKSTLLNALAETEVSPASVRRPTTGRPVAWVPSDTGSEIGGLLDWLGVEETREHPAEALSSVAIIDLPDLDSIARNHRRRVEAILPKVDAVIWVSDPEKYRDAVLHDDFLRHWVPRLDRQLVVLNKIDRLAEEDVERVRLDLERSLADDMVKPGATVRVIATAAAQGDVKPVREWLAEQADAKRVVVGRIAASVVASLEQLAREASVDPEVPPPSLLDKSSRERAIGAATGQVLRLVDLPAAEAQAVAATRAAARPRGSGPLGWIIGWLYRASGREARVADPELFLRSWDERGSLAPALDALRAAVDAPLRDAPRAIRPAIAASNDDRRLAARLRTAVNGAIATRGSIVPPTSRLWPVLGLAQTIVTLAIVVSIVWIALLVLTRPPVDMVALPILGRVPMPLALLGAALLAGFLISRVLAVHAGWLGRQWARTLAADVHDAVERAVADEAFAPLDRVDAARRAVWLATRRALESCAHP